MPTKSICIVTRCSCLLVMVSTLLLSACAEQYKYGINQDQASAAEKYNTNSLAKEWRERVKKNPRNPYENYGGYEDNDWDYVQPKRRVKRKYTAPSPDFQDNDSAPSYRGYPKYNPDEDNTYLDPKNYPLYLD